jgi:outer membrane cobalamin receptor
MALLCHCRLVSDRRIIAELSDGAMTVATPEFCDFTFTARNLYNRASVNAQSSFVLSNFIATGGYDYEVENASLSLLAAGHVRRNNQAGYLDFRYSPHPRASLSFGARAEANGNFGTRVVPRAGASLALLQGRGFWGETRLRAFYGEGIKEPRFDQLYSDQFGDIGNPTLKPEASKTWSVGLEQHLGDGRVQDGPGPVAEFVYAPGDYLARLTVTVRTS